MTAKELDVMVNAMRSRYNKVETRSDVTDPIFRLFQGLKEIGRTELAIELFDLYSEIEGIDTSEIVKLGTFDQEERYEN